MKLLKIFLASTIALCSWAYCPPSVMSRRSLLKKAVASSVLIPPSLVFAEEEILGSKGEHKGETSNTVKNIFDMELEEFRLWRKRGSRWLQRRLKRQKVSQTKDKT